MLYRIVILLFIVLLLNCCGNNKKTVDTKDIFLLKDLNNCKVSLDYNSNRCKACDSQYFIYTTESVLDNLNIPTNILNKIKDSENLQKFLSKRVITNISKSYIENEFLLHCLRYTIILYTLSLTKISSLKKNNKLFVESQLFLSNLTILHMYLSNIYGIRDKYKDFDILNSKLFKKIIYPNLVLYRVNSKDNKLYKLYFGVKYNLYKEYLTHYIKNIKDMFDITNSYGFNNILEHIDTYVNSKNILSTKSNSKNIKYISELYTYFSKYNKQKTKYILNNYYIIYNILLKDFNSILDKFFIKI